MSYQHIIRTLILCMSSAICTCYPYLQESIPNGKNVPHPCIKGLKWEGVGHENHRGGGARNIFGVDFNNNNKVWDSVICNKDSDGDGKTNGEELGDPDCTWTPDSNPKYTSGLSHPGICEPFDSPKCDGQPSFVDCDDSGKLECDAINEPDTFNYTVRFPETPVPAKETTYMCITFELPMDKEYHLVAHEPYIDNHDVMHHILVYGCEGANEAPRSLMEPKECGQSMDGCRELIVVWGVGSAGNCHNNKMGFLIGANEGLKYAVMQFHWNNPQRKNDFKDSSGIKFYLTPKLRPNNAGALITGQGYLNIPPGQRNYSATGSCGGSCLSQVLDGDIYVTQVLNHMHLLGVAQITELRRNDSFVRFLAQDRVYNYNTPVTHIHSDPVLVRPGDELKTTCSFNSETRTEITKFGEATSDEMCLAFFTYYPKENLRTGRCIAWNSLNFCEIRYQNVVRGCDKSKFFNPSDPETMQIISSVTRLCDADICLDDCFNYVKDLKEHPCFAGDVGKFLRREYSRKSQNKLETMAWFNRLDSCDLELYVKDDETSAGGVALPFQALLLSFWSLLILSC